MVCCFYWSRMMIYILVGIIVFVIYTIIIEYFLDKIENPYRLYIAILVRAIPISLILGLVFGLFLSRILE